MPLQTKHLSPRFLSLPGLAVLLLSACNTPDAALGVDQSLTNDAGGHASSNSALFRVDLGTLGGSSSYAADINGNEIVVGWSETSSGATHAFRWSANGGMVDLGTLPGDSESRAVAIIDGATTSGGQILGVSGSGAQWTPVTWSASGSISRLPIGLIPSFTFGLPVGFNSAGDVVGWDGGLGLQHGWKWSADAGKYDLSANVEGGSNEGSAGGVTASGLVVLTTRAFTCHQNPQCWRTYLWSKTQGYAAVGTPGSDPEASVTGLGISEQGTVVGWATINEKNAFPYRWTVSTGFTPLSQYSNASNSYGYATAVNSAGTVVGAAFEPTSGSIVATTWPATGGIVRLSADDPNPSVAVAINSAGTIAGWASVSDHVNHAVVWSSSLKGSHSNLLVPGPTPRYLSSASTPCLKGVRAILTRQALFSCAINADHGR
ncbi:MAG TPA: hypothetical protein VGN73_13495 [Gemmatimonadaceae bacterium]|nr:hypothetical protein [Gemmatimonadaceae bacterium]